MEGSAATDRQLWDQVEAVLNSGMQAGLALTGGGSQTITWLLNHPGASRFVLEIQVPYHGRALDAYLQRPGPHSATEETARCMALRARRRAVEFADSDQGILGVSCSAALATRRVRRGRDRGCIGLRLDGEYLLYTVEFVKGAADRLEQEEILSRFILQVLADASKVAPLRADQWPEWVAVAQSNLPVDEVLEAFLEGAAEVVEANLNGAMSSQVDRSKRLLFPGSFNPFHQGHGGLAGAAAKRSGRPAVLELSVENVDKPALSYEEVYSRIQRVDGRFSGNGDPGTDLCGKGALVSRLPLCRGLRYCRSAGTGQVL